MKSIKSNATIDILLADDDKDDHFFFSRVLKSLSFATKLTIVEDGEQLMTHLLGASNILPDVLFLDQNMPRKNGWECLLEIKGNKALQALPIIIYSTDIYENVEDLFYNSGAHYYIRKTSLDELKKVLSVILTLIAEKKFIRPARENFKFILSNNKVVFE